MPFSTADSRVASTVYEGARNVEEEGEGRTWRLNELVGSKAKVKFRLVKAVPGCAVFFLFFLLLMLNRSSIPIVDDEGRIYALVIYPNNPSIKQAAEEAAKLLRDSRDSCSFTTKQCFSRRGNFGALNAGIAHGNGRTVSCLSIRWAFIDGLCSTRKTSATIKQTPLFLNGLLVQHPSNVCLDLLLVGFCLNMLQAVADLFSLQVFSRRGPPASTITAKITWTSCFPATARSSACLQTVSCPLQHSTLGLGLFVCPTLTSATSPSIGVGSGHLDGTTGVRVDTLYCGI